VRWLPFALAIWLLSTASAALTVSATCRVATANFNFGPERSSETIVGMASTIDVQCSKALPYSVALDGGQSAAADPTQRKISKEGEHASYGLYRDQTPSQPWGSTPGRDIVFGVGDAMVQTLIVYDHISAQPMRSLGVYADTVVVTVTY
jgi:spore coat protein U-like protein